MIMPAGRIRARFGLEGCQFFGHQQVHLAQHVGQHVVGCQLQQIGLQFQCDMPVAQVVGGAQQIERAAVFGARANHQHRLRRGDHLDQRPVLGHQHVAAAHHRATRQEHAQVPAL